jgi:transposase-like protein
MTYIAVRCLHCQSEQIVKRGKTAQGTQRYLCQNTLCAVQSFLLHYRNCGCLPEIKQQIIDMSLNASGVRDTARSLHICPNTVLRELKKKEGALELVNTAVLRTLKPTGPKTNTRVTSRKLTRRDYDRRQCQIGPPISCSRNRHEINVRHIHRTAPHRLKPI